MGYRIWRIQQFRLQKPLSRETVARKFAEVGEIIGGQWSLDA